MNFPVQRGLSIEAVLGIMIEMSMRRHVEIYRRNAGRACDLVRRTAVIGKRYRLLRTHETRPPTLDHAVVIGRPPSGLKADIDVSHGWQRNAVFTPILTLPLKPH